MSERVWTIKPCVSPWEGEPPYWKVTHHRCRVDLYANDSGHVGNLIVNHDCPKVYVRSELDNVYDKATGRCAYVRRWYGECTHCGYCTQPCVSWKSGLRAMKRHVKVEHGVTL